MDALEYLRNAIDSRELRARHASILVRHWQSQNGLIADGLLGPRTVASLHAEANKRGGVRDLQRRALQIALAEIGNGEDPAVGNNRGADVYRYRKGDATGAAWNLGAPWCAAFVSYCYARAAADLGLELPFETSRSAKTLTERVASAGRRCAHPEVGALICWHRSRLGARSRKGHIAFIASYDAASDTVVTVDGNRNLPGERFATVEDFHHPNGRWRRRLYLMATLAPRDSILASEAQPLALPSPDRRSLA